MQDVRMSEMCEFVKSLEEMPLTLPSEGHYYPYFLQQYKDKSMALALSEFDVTGNGLRRGPRGAELVNCPYNESHKVWEKHIERHVVLCREEWKATLNPVTVNGLDESLQVTCKYDWRHQVYVKEKEFHEETCPSQFHLTRHITETERVDGIKTRKVCWEQGIPCGYGAPTPEHPLSVCELKKGQVPPVEMKLYVVDAQKTGIVSLIRTTSVWTPGVGITLAKIYEQRAAEDSSSSQLSSPSDIDQGQQQQLPILDD